MKYKKIIEILIYLLIIGILIYILTSQYKTLEKFTVLESTPENITNEMYKQLLLLKQINNISSQKQINKNLPHLDVINSYKNKSKIFLDSLKNKIDTDLTEKNDYLSKLDNTILRLSQYKDDNFLKELKNTDFKTIKSHNNGLNIALNRIGFDNYQVKVNNGCMNVTTENDYNVVPCNVSDKGQHFKLNHIFNETEYRNSLSKAFPQLSELNNVHYPLSLVKSKATDNCLKNTHGKLSVEPCREYEGQRWASIKTENSCKKLF